MGVIFVTRLLPIRAVYFMQTGNSALNALLYLTLEEVLTKYISLKFNAL